MYICRTLMSWNETSKYFSMNLKTESKNILKLTNNVWWVKSHLTFFCSEIKQTILHTAYIKLFNLGPPVKGKNSEIFLKLLFQPSCNKLEICKFSNWFGPFKTKSEVTKFLPLPGTWESTVRYIEHWRLVYIMFVIQN